MQRTCETTYIELLYNFFRGFSYIYKNREHNSTAKSSLFFTQNASNTEKNTLL